MKHRYPKRLGVLVICGSLAAGNAVAAGTAASTGTAVLAGAAVRTAATSEVSISGKLWQYTKEKTDDGIFYDFKELKLKLPKSWEEKYVMEDCEGGVDFFHKASREAGEKEGDENCGFLFGLKYSENYDFTETLSDYYLLGSGEEGVYYITVPTDAHGYEKDDTVSGEWKELSGSIQEICENAEAVYPGAPMYTNTYVNFRENASKDSKALDVIPSEMLVWVTGSLEKEWAQVHYEEEDGFVKREYLEFPDEIGAVGEEDEDSEDSAQNEGKAENTDKNSDGRDEGDTADGSTGAASAADDSASGDDRDEAEDGEDEAGTDSSLADEIARQHMGSAIMYDSQGDSVHVQLAEDGNWYDENGVLYYGDVDESAANSDPVTNENGDTYYFAPPEG